MFTNLFEAPVVRDTLFFYIQLIFVVFLLGFVKRSFVFAFQFNLLGGALN